MLTNFFLLFGNGHANETFYIKEDKIYFFGWGEYIKVGLPARVYMPTEVNISGMDAQNVNKIFPDWAYQITVLKDGNIIESGIYVEEYFPEKKVYKYENLGIDSKIIDAVGLFNSRTGILLTDTGNVYGYGKYSQLGLNNNSESTVPNIMKLNLENVISIHVVNGAFIAITEDGKVYGTGSNIYGILGRWVGVDRGTSNSRYKTALNWVECPELEI